MSADTFKDGTGVADTSKFEVMAGKDTSGNAQPIKVATTGEVHITGSVTATVSGVATETTLADIETDVDTLLTTASTIATNTGNTATALADVATETTLATLATEATLGSIDTALADVATETTLATLATEATVGTLATEATASAIETLAGTIDTSAAAAAASLGVIDNWDESDRAKVNPIAGQAGIAGGTGTMGANVTRVTTCTDDPFMLQFDAQFDTLIGTVDQVVSQGDSGNVSVGRALDVDESMDNITTTNSVQIVSIHAFNTHATDLRYLKIYDDESPDENDTPVFTFPLSPMGGFTRTAPIAKVFSTGISVRATTGVADNSTGAPGANEVIVNIEYRTV